MENKFVNSFFKTMAPLLLDGAMGSYLQSKYNVNDPDLWTTELLLNSSDIVVEAHSQYISSGADIITTNTFRTNPAALKKANLDESSDKLVNIAVKSAKEAIEYKKVFIAGSNAPAEDCYQSKRTLSLIELKQNHIQHIDNLITSGCDFILNETQSHFDEIELICDYCSSNSIPYVVSLYFDNPDTILSGELITDVIQYINGKSPILISFNCISTNIFSRFIAKHTPDYPWGFYLNCGSGNINDTEISCGISPEQYASTIKPLLNKKSRMIGTCCGSDFSHTQYLRRFIDEKDLHESTGKN